MEGNSMIGKEVEHTTRFGVSEKDPIDALNIGAKSKDAKGFPIT
ncbi:MAG: hypothetical protein ACLP9D_15160 [Candidatus Bathyarchaeia archaeon]